MKHLSLTRVCKILCIVLLFVGGWMVATDCIVRWFGLIRAWQYLYNAVYFFILLPLCILGVDVVNPFKEQNCTVANNS